jgi:hypothetical protein
MSTATCDPDVARRVVPAFLVRSATREPSLVLAEV